MKQRFSKVLVANRGEIACRVLTAAQNEGYQTVAVYSDADAGARHVQLADQAVRIGPPPSSDSYLSIESILDAARATGAQAIHPGYGFLAENAAFARACEDAGVTFIGPPAEAIRLMGDKAEAKRRMIEAGVPCVPGYEGEAQDDGAFAKAAERIGYPILVKAAAGGGGRGMRQVRAPEDLSSALADARAEAKKAFGDGALLLEKLVEDARHVEIQVLADTHGACIHLGERDCSVQRRYQKIIEESPSPAVDEALRNKMGEAAVAAAQAVGYTNAGTVEFLLDEDGNFYFLEMNTRLQVEHPVTEAVTGLDLVALQLAVAQGEPLPIEQTSIQFRGHAIEVRVYAEDPAQNFAPQTGPILLWEPPTGAGVRVDHGLHQLAEITPYYDPLLAKVIVHGDSRAQALERLQHALRSTVLLGVGANMEFLQQILAHETFATGAATTAFLPAATLPDLAGTGSQFQRLAIAAAILVEHAATHHQQLLRGWRSTGPAKMPIRLAAGDDTHNLVVEMSGAEYHVTLDEESAHLRVNYCTASAIQWQSDNLSEEARFAIHNNQLYLHYRGRTTVFRDETYAPPASVDALSDGLLKAPMAGQIARVDITGGDRVTKGQVLLILEAMKIENQIVAPADGVVNTVHVKVGDQVDANQTLVTLETGEMAEATTGSES